MILHSLQGKLFPEPPFDFSKYPNFVGMFAPPGGEQVISGLSFTKQFTWKIGL